MKFTCNISVGTKTTTRGGRLYHANIPVISGFRKATGLGGWLRMIGEWIGRSRGDSPVGRSTGATTKLVVQASPATLASMAMCLYGMNTDGSDVEFTVIPAVEGSSCQSKSSSLLV